MTLRQHEIGYLRDAIAGVQDTRQQLEQLFQTGTDERDRRLSKACRRMALAEYSFDFTGLTSFIGINVGVVIAVASLVASGAVAFSIGLLCAGAVAAGVLTSSCLKQAGIYGEKKEALKAARRLETPDYDSVSRALSSAYSREETHNLIGKGSDNAWQNLKKAVSNLIDAASAGRILVWSSDSMNVIEWITKAKRNQLPWTEFNLQITEALAGFAKTSIDAKQEDQQQPATLGFDGRGTTRQVSLTQHDTGTDPTPGSRQGPNLVA